MAYKDGFAAAMSLLSRFYPEEYDFIPRTFLVPGEADLAAAHMEKHSKRTFIAKPAQGGQGDGIIILKKY